jgi:hypothetical protein
MEMFNISFQICLLLSAVAGQSWFGIGKLLGFPERKSRSISSRVFSDTGAIEKHAASPSKILSTLTQTQETLTKQVSDIQVQSTGIFLSPSGSSSSSSKSTVKSSPAAKAKTTAKITTTSTEPSSLPDEVLKNEEVEVTTVSEVHIAQAPVPLPEEEDDMNLGISSSCVATLCG